MRVGLIGRNGSGKTVACDYLVEARGFLKVSLSDSVRERARELGRALDRDSLIFTANELKDEGGFDVLARMAVRFSEDNENVVFDSIRHPDEVLYLKRHGVFLVGVDAPIEVRYSRILDRNGATDMVSFEEFCRQEELESDGRSPGQQLNQVMGMCDVVLNNEGVMGDFLESFEEALA